jgi:hypothetical protein
MASSVIGVIERGRQSRWRATASFLPIIIGSDTFANPTHGRGG